MIINISPACLTARGVYVPTPCIADGSFRRWRMKYRSVYAAATPPKPLCVMQCGRTVAKVNGKCLRCARNARAEQPAKQTGRPPRPLSANGERLCARCETPRVGSQSYCRFHVNEFRRTAYLKHQQKREKEIADRIKAKYGLE